MSQLIHTSEPRFRDHKKTHKKALKTLDNRLKPILSTLITK